MAGPTAAVWRRPAVRTLVLAMLILGAHLLLAPALDGLRGRAFDLYQAVVPPAGAPDGIVLVGIDDEALAQEGRWPWPRDRIASLIERIGAAGPAALGIDILFPEPGPAEGDAALAAAIARTRAVLATSLVEGPGTAMPTQPAGWSVVGEGSPTLAAYSGFLASRPDFTERAGGLGIVRSVPDPDGVTRSVPVVWAVPAGEDLAFWPAMALELARVSRGAPGYVLRLGTEGYDAIRVGDRTVPLTAGGALWLADSRAPVRTIGASAVLAGSARADLAGRIVILSVTATGFDSFHTTPLVATRPGAEIHALLTAQVLNGPFPHEPADALATERLVFLVLALALAACLHWLNRRKTALLAIAALLLASPFLLGLTAFLLRQTLYDAVQPTIGLAVLAGAGSYFLYREEEARRQRIGSQFARYLSPRVVEALIQSEADVTRSAERRIVTVVFIDMRGFTAASEALPPHLVVATVNRFLTMASEEIFRTDGTIDKFMGDAVMAFWNAPLDQPDHPRLAKAAVEALLSRLAAENRSRASQGLDPVRVGIGMESGPCSVGNFGSDLRYNFTVIGQAANLAARLEVATKQAGVPVLAGPGFAALAPDLVKPAGLFELAGFRDPVPGFAVKISPA